MSVAIPPRMAKLWNSGLSLLSERLNRAHFSVGYYQVPNFGDQLTPIVFSHFGMTARHCPNFRFATAVGVGSILHMVPPSYRGWILGSGLIRHEKRLLKRCRPALVRGHLTCEGLALPSDTRLGDPGLIVGDIFATDTNKKKYDVGIVPHYVDFGSEALASLVSQTAGQNAIVVDPRKPVAQVVEDIAQCRLVLSSSLHGLIVADSLGVANTWIQLSDRIIGGDFKYRDYYSSLSENKHCVVVGDNSDLKAITDRATMIDPDKIARTKQEISNAFLEFYQECVG